MEKRLTFLAVARFLTILMPVTFLFGPAVSDVVLCLILALFLADCAMQDQWEWLHERWVKIAFVLTAYMTLRSLLVPNPLEVVPQALVWLRLPLFAAALAYGVLPESLKTQHWLLRTSLCVCLFLAADTLLQFFYGVDILGHPSFLSEGYPRLTGPFRSPHVGMTLVWLLFPAVAYTLNRTAPRFQSQAILGMVLLGTSTLAVYLSGERMALILLAIGAALSFLLMPRVRLFLVVVVIITGAAGWQLAQMNEIVAQRQVQSTTQTVVSFWDTVYGRTWNSAMEIIHDHPLFGVGMKQFQTVCVEPQYGPNGEGANALRCPLHPHNMYLAWFAEGGVIGGGLLLLIFISWAVIGLRQWRYLYKTPIALGLLIALSLRLFPISVTPNHLATWVVVPLWFYAGWLLALLEEAYRNAPPPPDTRPRLPFNNL